MFPRNLAKTFRSVALLGVVSLGVAACDDPADPDIIIPADESITLTPQSVTMFPQQTVQLSASVTGVENATVTFRSSDESVVKVDANTGVVTAQNVTQEEIATVTASVTGRANLTASTVITVRPRQGEDPGNPGTISIGSVTYANNQQVVPDSVGGTIFVRLNVEPGNAEKLEVLLGDRVVCTQTFTSTNSAAASVDANGHLDMTQAQVEIVCPINTARFEIVNGVAQITFPNGAENLTARLVTPDGTVAASVSTQFNLRNQDLFGLDVDVDDTAINPNTGLRWADGTVTITAYPVIFSGASVGTVFITMAGETESDSEAPYTAVFRETVELDDKVGQFPITVSATTATGGEIAGGSPMITVVSGDAGAAISTTAVEGMTVLRYDNDPPNFTGTVTDTTYVNGAFGFNTLTEDVTTTDVEDGTTGVNAVTFRYFVGTASQSDEAILATTPVTDASTLNETRTNNALRLIVRACDALENCVTVPNAGDALFGVDREAPVITSVSRVDAINPDETTITVMMRDTLSGFSAAPVRVREFRILPSGTTCEIGTGTSCAPVADDGSVTVVTTQGYHRYEIYVVDRAGNRSETRTVFYLADTVAPTVSEIGFTAPVTGGQDETFSATISDNVDLGTYLVQTSYNNGGILLPMTQTRLISGFGEPLVASFNASETFFFVRCVDGSAATQVQFAAGDVAGNAGARNTAIPTQTCGDAPPAPTINAPATIKEGNNSVTLTASITVNNVNAEAPYNRVIFYANPNGTGAELISADLTGSQTTSETSRTFTYTATYNASALDEGNTVNFFALGVDDEGDGTRSAEITRTIAAP